MSIIDWFRKKLAEKTTAKDNILVGYEDSNHPDNVIPFVTPGPAEPLKLVKPVDKRNKDPVYTVGLNDFNETVLRLYNADSSTTMTLTMSFTATLQLIRMLEATLQDEGTEDNDGL